MPQRAIIIKSQGVAALVDDQTVPQLRPDYMLVKVCAVALNPTDWKHVDYFPAEGAIVGCDYAGVVLAVGNAVTNPVKTGDRVCGFVHGGNSVNLEDGTFAEYIIAKGDLQMKIPTGMSYEVACGLGVGISTVGQGLYQSLRLPLPQIGAPTISHHRTPLLVYGGSTATGTLAIQYAKL
jgi:NADPH:quinone reductase-like Zn-dependent oxidoreductase